MVEFEIAELANYDVELIREYLESDEDNEYIIHHPVRYLEQDDVDDHSYDFYLQGLVALYLGDCIQGVSKFFSYAVPDLEEGAWTYYHIIVNDVHALAKVLCPFAALPDTDYTIDGESIWQIAEELYYRIKLHGEKTACVGLLPLVERFDPNDENDWKTMMKTD